MVCMRRQAFARGEPARRNVREAAIACGDRLKPPGTGGALDSEKVGAVDRSDVASFDRKPEHTGHHKKASPRLGDGGDPTLNVVARISAVADDCIAVR